MCSTSVSMVYCLSAEALSKRRAASSSSAVVRRRVGADVEEIGDAGARGAVVENARIGVGDGATNLGGDRVGRCR
jgi:hypothetical protein